MGSKRHFPGEDPRFRGTEAAAAKAGAQGIKHLGLADWVFNKVTKVPFFNKDIRTLNLSLEDWASRVNVVLSVYLFQAYFSLKKKAHIWETNIRNLLMWSMTFGIALFAKNDRIGMNAILDKVFMRPKVTKASVGKDIQRLGDWQVDFQKDRQGLIDKLKIKMDAAAAREFDTLMAEGKDTKRFFKTLKKDLNLSKDDAKSFADEIKRFGEVQERIGQVNKRLQKKNALLPLLESPETTPRLEKLLNKTRLDYDYFEFFEDTNLKINKMDRWKAFWSGLDGNQVEYLSKKGKEVLEQIEIKAAELRKLDYNTLPRVEQELVDKADRLKKLPAFANRMSTFRVLSLLVVTGLTIYLIGVKAMEWVFKYIAPLDPDFDISKARNVIGYPDFKVGAHPPSFKQPNAFKNLRHKTDGGLS